MKRTKFMKKGAKLIFWGLAASVGVILTVNTVKKKGDVIRKKSEKVIKDVKRNIRSSTDNLNDRQKKILTLFVKNDKVTNEMINAQIPGISERTIRRDLQDLEKKKYIRQIGKTRGSYYVAK